MNDGTEQVSTLDYVQHNVTRRTPKPEIEAAVERVWEEFWLPLLARTTEIAEIDLTYFFDSSMPSRLFKQIKYELFDCHEMMRNTSKLMWLITDGQVSKPLTDADTVASIAEEASKRDAGRNLIEWLETQRDEHECVSRAWTIDGLIEQVKKDFNVEG